MHIQELNIQGFRSLRDITWKPGKLNVLIGPNGSGKSNLLRALELLQRATQGRLADEILKQGGINPLLWDNQAEQIFWRLTKGLIKSTTSTYELKLRQRLVSGSYLVWSERLYRGEALLLERRVGSKDTIVELNGERISEGLAIDLPEDETLLSMIGPLIFGTPFDFTALTFRKDLGTWRLYHDIQVDQSAPLRHAAVARMESWISPDGQNLIPVLHTLYSGKREFKRTVDQSMRAAFGPEYEELVFPPAADQRIQLRIRWRSLRTEQSAADLSDGTLRFLLLLAILANPEPGLLIAIDEPETGLHPNMFPIIAELAAEAAERTQVILTTHSPQFLDAFKDEPPTTTVAQWDQGETRLSVVDGEELRRWLQDYSLGALFRSGELEALA